MKYNQYWSLKYDCPVSLTFSDIAKTLPKNRITIDITKCIIRISPEGFYYLYFQGKRIKKLTFSEFMKYRKSVKEIIEEYDEH